MIKIYSELDRKDRKGFGRRRMRKDLAGCYFNVHTHLLFLSSPFFIFVTVTFLLLIYVHHHFFLCFLMQSAPSTNTCCAHCGSYSEHMPAHHKETMHEKFSSALPGNVCFLIHSLLACIYIFPGCLFWAIFSCFNSFFVNADHRWHL